MTFAAIVVSCAERANLRAETFRSLAWTDWDGSVDVVLDDGAAGATLRRIDATWYRALRLAAESSTDFVLMTEDDVAFNRFLRHNLESWSPLQGLRANDPLWASLYHPQHPSFRVSSSPEGADYHIVDPAEIWGGQGVLVSPSLAAWVVRHLPTANPHPHDRWLPYLAARLCPRLYLHRPSLVQHVGVSTWGGPRHVARDFDLFWRAGQVSCAPTLVGSPGSW